MEPRLHVVAVVALHGVAPFDLGAAAQVFGAARTEQGVLLYHLLICGEASLVHGMGFDVKPNCGFERLATADTVIVAGTSNFDRPIPGDLLRALRAASSSGARICSICYGAFVLAAAGLLDHRRAVTHWLGAKTLARRYPAVTVEQDAVIVDEGSIVTSAGAAAGVEMCLHLIRRDFGGAVATRAERIAMGPARRDATSTHLPPILPSTEIDLILDWMSAHYAQPLTMPVLAARAKVSERTFSRRFRAQVGTTPHQWLLAERVRHARGLLESSSKSIEQVAIMTGFESATAFRAKFQHLLGMSPSAYRRSFAGTNTPHAQVMGT